MSNVIRNLLTVHVAQHVVDECHTSHFCKLSTTSKFWHPARSRQKLFAIRNLLSDLFCTGLLQAAAVTMRAQHCRAWGFWRNSGPEQHTCHKMSRQAFEIDFLHRESITCHFSMDHRIQRRLLRYRPQPDGDQYTLLQLGPSYLPRSYRIGNLKREVAIQIFGSFQANVVRLLSGIQNLMYRRVTRSCLA